MIDRGRAAEEMLPRGRDQGVVGVLWISRGMRGHGVMHFDMQQEACVLGCEKHICLSSSWGACQQQMSMLHLKMEGLMAHSHAFRSLNPVQR